MRLTLTRQERGRGKAALAVAGALTVLAGGSLLAAPGGSAGWPISLSGPDGYAVRIALSAPRQRAADATVAGTRKAAFDELNSAPADQTDEPIAIASAPVALPTSAAARPDRRTKALGLIPLSYSLAGGADAGDAIEVEKPVMVGGSDAGRIALRIDGNARVYALGSRLAAIIAAQSGAAAVPEGLGEDFVSLERLRALGLGVRYDAIGDRLVIDPPV